jgi:AcrR family transcriptional regulator
MEFKLSFKVNDHIYLRDPESSELGMLMVKNAIELIHNIGFEQFTFKKLALEMNTTEATIYRYFENKHRLLLYILNWYWSYMEYLVIYRIQNLKDSKSKLKTIIEILTNDLPESNGKLEYNRAYLTQIVIAESSKVYLVKDIKEINKEEVFKPYKDLCAKIASIIKEYNPKYKYGHSLSTTIIEASHQQQYFAKHLPRLTDIKNKNEREYTALFLEELLFKVLS